MGEERILRSIQKWENQLNRHMTNDFERMYEISVQSLFSKMPSNYQKRFYEMIDQWILYTYTFLQGTNSQAVTNERIMQVARTFDDNIETISDLKHLSIEQLTYIADQQLSKSRVYSFAQGGVTGAGGWLLLGFDFPLMVTMNLRSVQLIGSSFGYDMNNPIEMMLALKVLNGGVLPKRYQYESWNHLKDDLHSLHMIMEKEEPLSDDNWFEQIINQIFKSIAITMFRKKLVQGVPIISVGIGAVSNYRLSKKVTDFAKHFYQYRHLYELKNKRGE